jgi:DNA-binding LytR/AlgR family response regulator
MACLKAGVPRESLVRAGLIATAAGLFLAFIGPFGSDQLSVAARLAYWLGLTLGGTGLGLAVNIGVAALIDPARRRPWVLAGATALAMTPPGVAAAWIATRLAFPPPVRIGDPLGFIAPVLAVSVVMSLINALANRRPVQTHAAPLGAGRPRFEARMPTRLKGAEIFAVEAEDHYLRLHTSKGSDLILMRLSDAMAELEGLEGAQTHRSWWVARPAVTGARRADGRATLTLKGGIEAPVSRSYAPALRAEGWF